jgi:regulator of ribonuclease activity A
MSFKTADLCDDFSDVVQMAEPIFRDYGGTKTFHGAIVTVKIFEDNVLVRQMLETPGEGRVLVIDGGGSTRCALVGDMLAQLAADNGWAGIVVYGCIRDSADIAEIPIGLKAINTVPRKSWKKGEGDTNRTVNFAGVTFQPGHHLYADVDGILVAEQALIRNRN